MNPNGFGAFSHLFYQHSRSKRGSADSESVLLMCIVTSFSIPDHTEDLQLVSPNCSGTFSHLLYQHSKSQRWSAVHESKLLRCIFTLFYRHSSSQKRICSQWTQIASVHFHICFISTPGPQEDLQLVSRNGSVTFSLLFYQHPSSQRGYAVSESKSLRCSFTFVLSAFQPPKRICN